MNVGPPDRIGQFEQMTTANDRPGFGNSGQPWWRWLALATVVPIAVTAALYRWDVPLGDPDWIAYPYSPFVGARLLRVPAAVAMGGMCAWGVWWMAGDHRGRRRVGGALFGAGCAGLAVWSFTAPPAWRSQQAFNLLSPSHDGAFLLESAHVDGLRDYLARFPERAATPPAEMRGTRVISNPPGTTVLAVGTTVLLERWPALARRIDPTTEADGLTPDQHRLVTKAIAFGWALTGLWLASVPFLYLAARVYLPPAAAATVAFCCFVSPMTLAFAPGKDAAQLFTVAVPLWLWLRACRDGRWWHGAGAGAAFTLACLVSLVHVWIAAILIGAGLWHARRDTGGVPMFVRLALVPAAGGAAVGLVLLHVCLDCDLIAIASAVARAQSAIVRGPDSMPLGLELLGIPLFLLLVGPAWWWGLPRLVRLRPDHADARLGRWLHWSTAAVLLATIGFTNMEAPRLWIPFLPLLVLAAHLCSTPARAGRRASTVRWLLAALVVAQTFCSAAQWSVLDAREAEMRLSTNQPRFFE